MSISDKISLYQTHESPHVRNRASIILLTLDGQSSEEIAEKVGLTLATVKKWQMAWENDGLDIFPEIEDMPVEDIVETPIEKVSLEEPIESPIEEAEETPIDSVDETQAENTDIVEVVEESQEKPANLHKLILPEIPSLEATHSMAEAGRIIMLGQLQAMLEHESLARKGKNIEGVHQMRVATRRWRSAYDTFGDYLPKAYHKKLPKALKYTAKRLGKVRDLDVFLLKVDEDLQLLIDLLKKDRKKARKQLVGWLDEKDYRRFIKGAFKLLSQPIETETLIIQAGELTSIRLDHVLPVMIYQRFEAVRRYEELVPNAPIDILHSLRKDCKRFRYILEMFSDVLGEEAQLVIGATKMIQDHLGDMNDAGVAIDIVRSVEKRVKKSERLELKAYRKARQVEITHLRENFSEVWAIFNQADIRYALAQAVAVL